MNATTDDLADLLKKIVGLQSLDARLWNADDVALFLNLSVDHVRKYIMVRSDFPAAVDLPGRGKEPIKRYRPVDVRDWAETYRR